MTSRTPHSLVVCAAGLALLTACGQPIPPTSARPTPATMASATAVPSASPAAAVASMTPVAAPSGSPSPVSSAAEEQTVLKVHMVRGFVTVSVNGNRLGRYGQKDPLKPEDGNMVTLDLDENVKPGENELRLEWDEQRVPVGEVHVSATDSAGAFRELTSYNFPVTGKSKGQESVTFVLSGPSASSPASPSVDAPAGVVAAGSHDQQSMVVANLQQGHITVFINDKRIGSYASGLNRLDISDAVTKGANKLRLEWKGDSAPMGSLSVAYAEEKDKFRDLIEHNFTPLESSDSPLELDFQMP